MNNIEDDIDLIKTYLKAMKDVEMGSDVVLLIAIQNLVKEYENLIQENKELRIQISARETVVDELTKENEELKSEIQHKNDQILLTDRGIDRHYIPKSKVKEKIEEMKRYRDYRPVINKFTYSEIIDYEIKILQELLEEGDDK